MVTKILLVLISAAVIGVLGGCGQSQSTSISGKVIEVEGGSFVDIMPEELNSMLQDKDFLLVNVHIPYEGEIAGTDLFLPYNEIEGSLSLLPKDKRLVLYCRSGSMSTLAAKTLVRLGYKNIWHLHGGMVQWELDGYPLLQLAR